MIDKLQFLRSLILSKKTNRKILVIESDDWGSERIPNKVSRELLQKKGIDMISNPHSLYDTLERLEDLVALEMVLNGVEKNYQKKVKITANFITTNPDFENIKKSKFENYFFEPFDKTYFRRDGHHKVLDKIHQLCKANYLRPQFHGREHINVNLWLDELKNGNHNFLDAFNLNTYAIDIKNNKYPWKNLMAALVYEDQKKKDFVINSIQEGHQIFKNIFGYTSKTFIAPKYVWNPELEYTFEKCGFTHVQTIFYQQNFDGKEVKTIFHYTGQKSKYSNIKYLTRNVFFEPAYGGLDWVKKSLEKVNLAFKFRAPAIISMHRINFVGGLDDKLRDYNLKQFKILLEEIIYRYPNVEFLSSDELAEII